MVRILVGNAVSLLGSLLMVYAGIVKEKKRILLLQCVQFSLMACGNLILGGVTGALSGVGSLVRNLYCFFLPYSLAAKLGFIAAQIGFSAAINEMGWLGWLPILSACIFTWFLDLEDEVKFKWVIILCQSLWCAYDLYLLNYVSFAFDLLTISSNLAGIVRLRRSRSARK